MILRVRNLIRFPLVEMNCVTPIIERYRFLQTEHPELFAEEHAQWETARNESLSLFQPIQYHVHAVVVIRNQESDFPGPTWVEIVASPEGEYVTLRLPPVPNSKYAEKLAAELAESAKVTVTSRFLPIS